jgi:hypothetical protein
MSPFNGNPLGISADALRLLDRALSSIWRDELLKSALAGAKETDRSPDRPAPKKPIVSAKRQLRAQAAKL